MAEPNIENVRRILVVGSGAMGSQIGMVCALAGYEVTQRFYEVGSFAGIRETEQYLLTGT